MFCCPSSLDAMLDQGILRRGQGMVKCDNYNVNEGGRKESKKREEEKRNEVKGRKGKGRHYERERERGVSIPANTHLSELFA